MSDPAVELATVRLERIPLPLYARTQQHHDELFREFALIANPHPDSAAEVPARLLSLVAELRERFGGFTQGNREALAQAVERGLQEADLVYTVPADVASVARELGDLLDEADRFCRAGELLTLAADDEVVAFRRWFLGEFVAQILEGRPATPWPDR